MLGDMDFLIEAFVVVNRARHFLITQNKISINPLNLDKIFLILKFQQHLECFFKKSGSFPCLQLSTYIDLVIEIKTFLQRYHPPRGIVCSLPRLVKLLNHFWAGLRIRMSLLWVKS